MTQFGSLILMATDPGFIEINKTNYSHTAHLYKALLLQICYCNESVQPFIVFLLANRDVGPEDLEIAYQAI